MMKPVNKKRNFQSIWQALTSFIAVVYRGNRERYIRPTVDYKYPPPNLF